MAVPFSNTKLRPPRGFRNIIEGLSREVLRDQPTDIYAFGTLYFDRLLEIRQESGFDPAQIGAELEDRFYNKVFKRIGEDIVEQEAAALKIQTKYRQYRAKSLVTAMREDRAATKIQAGFHGFLARKLTRRMRQESSAAVELARQQAARDDERAVEEEGDLAATLASEDSPDDINESEIETLHEYEDAAVKIQAAFRGMLVRRSLKGALGTQQSDEADDEEEEQTPTE